MSLIGAPCLLKYRHQWSDHLLKMDHRRHWDEVDDGDRLVSGNRLELGRRSDCEGHCDNEGCIPEDDRLLGTPGIT